MRNGLPFEWDDAKAASNHAKHGVMFEYATRVFLDPQMVDFDATHHIDGEPRRKAVGLIAGLLYVVVYTHRDSTRRIISARRANATERHRYGPV